MNEVWETRPATREEAPGVCGRGRTASGRGLRLGLSSPGDPILPRCDEAGPDPPPVLRTGDASRPAGFLWSQHPLTPQLRIASLSDVTGPTTLFLSRGPDPGPRRWAHPRGPSGLPRPHPPSRRPPAPGAAPLTAGSPADPPQGRPCPAGRPRRSLLGAPAGFRTCLLRAAVPAAGGGPVALRTREGHVPGARARARAPASGRAERRRGYGRGTQSRLRRTG